VPTPFDAKEVQRRYPYNYNESTGTVLIQEVLRYNTLLKMIKRTLETALQVLQGVDYG